LRTPDIAPNGAATSARDSPTDSIPTAISVWELTFCSGDEEEWIAFFRNQTTITTALKRKWDIVIGDVAGMVTFLSNEEQSRWTGMALTPPGQDILMHTSEYSTTPGPSNIQRKD
jgi:hypothetical protein